MTNGINTGEMGHGTAVGAVSISLLTVTRVGRGISTSFYCMFIYIIPLIATLKP